MGESGKKAANLPPTHDLHSLLHPLFSLLLYLLLALFRLHNIKKLKHRPLILSLYALLKLSPPALFPSTPSTHYSPWLPPSLPPPPPPSMGFAGSLGFPSFGNIKTNQKIETCNNNSLKMQGWSSSIIEAFYHDCNYDCFRHTFCCLSPKNVVANNFTTLLLKQF